MRAVKEVVDVVDPHAYHVRSPDFGAFTHGRTERAGCGNHRREGTARRAEAMSTKQSEAGNRVPKPFVEGLPILLQIGRSTAVLKYL